MTYPDGEVVTYHNNAAGQVESLTSNKQDAALEQYVVTRPYGLSYKITDELEDLQTTGIKSIFTLTHSLHCSEFVELMLFIWEVWEQKAENGIKLISD